VASAASSVAAAAAGGAAGAASLATGAGWRAVMIEMKCSWPSALIEPG